MPKTIDAGRYPAHADLSDPAEAAWWERWAAVGDAKEAVARANERLAAVAVEWRDCRERAGLTDRPGPDCHCGECGGRYLEARDVRDVARAAVTEAELEFKAG